ncbi:B12-binding domain-containing radical SAM protein [Patescibacteria group bacterium]|nr:B12-binding domain-containing radical SAM protein [Patescibacteria group bacterium]
MKILLLMPKIFYECWPFPTDFWRCWRKIAGTTLPQLAAVIPEYYCDIFDGNVEKISLSEYKDKLAQYDIIAISVISPAASLNTEITIRMIKKISKDITVILGGHHATFYDRRWIQKGADIVVRREGEETFKAVIAAICNNEDLKGIKGITFKYNDEIIATADRDHILDLDKLPIPAWDKLSLANYKFKLGGKGFTASIETSRGCKHKCIFCCASSMWRYSQRYKSVERVIKEFKYLYKRGIDNIVIADDNFGSNYQRDKRILEGIISENMNVYLWMFCRADLIFNHPDFIELAVKAGLKEVIIGYESLNEEILKKYSKQIEDGMAVENFKDVYKALKQSNVLVFGAFVEDSLSGSNIYRNTMKHHSVCDIAMHQELIPMKGILGYEGLKRRRIIAIDTFYNARYISAYNGRKRNKVSISILERLQSIINGNAFKIMISSNTRHRREILGLYFILFKKLIIATPRKIVNFLICICPWISLKRRQDKIVARYINDRYIDALFRR